MAYTINYELLHINTTMLVWYTIMQTILSIDPGITIGIAYQASDGEYTTFITKQVSDLWDLIKLKPNVVIVERFAAEQISTYGLRTVEIVGGTEALCYAFDIKFVRRQPQSRKAFILQAREIVRSNPNYIAQKGHDSTHEVDALSHLLAYKHWGK